VNLSDLVAQQPEARSKAAMWLRHHYYELWLEYISAQSAAGLVQPAHEWLEEHHEDQYFEVMNILGPYYRQKVGVA